MEILPGVHLLPGATSAFMGLYAPNTYLIIGGKAAFIDSGYSDKAAIEAKLDYLEKIGTPSVEYIVITHSHPDHAGGAEALKLSTKAIIVTHPLDILASSLFITRDESVEEGDTLDLEGIQLDIIHTPGHSPGHICIYMRQKKLLFSGDHVPGIGTTVIFPPQGNMAQYIDSLRKLLNWDVEMICPGHGPIIREPRRKLQELIQHRLERERQVLSCLEQGKVTIEEMVQEIYPEIDHRLYDMAKGQVQAHLYKLEEEGRLSLHEKGRERL